MWGISYWDIGNVGMSYRDIGNMGACHTGTYSLVLSKWLAFIISVECSITIAKEVDIKSSFYSHVRLYS